MGKEVRGEIPIVRTEIRLIFVVTCSCSEGGPEQAECFVEVSYS